MNNQKPARRCKTKGCDNLIRSYNKTGVCTNCQKYVFWDKEIVKRDEKIRQLKKQMKLYDKLILDYYKRLKEYEPDLIWDEEEEK